VTAGRTWRYAATATELEVQRLDTVPIGGTPGRRRFVDAFIEGVVAAPVRVGVGWSAARLDDPTFQVDGRSTRGWVEYSRQNASAELAATRSAGRTFLSAAARITRSLGDSTRLELVASALNTRRFSEEDAMDPHVNLANVDPPSDMGVVDFRAEVATRSVLWVRPTVYARWFNYANTGESNRVSGVAFGLAVATSASARIAASMRAELSPLLGETPSSYRSTPPGFADATFSARVPGGFDLAMSGRYAPSTEWPPHLPVAPAASLPATRRVDFSANKWMWGNRVRAQLLMRNLLNAPDRTHPSGAQWNLRTHLAVTVALPSGAGR
jgi:hypothetical protein